MRNPTYEGDFRTNPMPERIASMSFLAEEMVVAPMLSSGIKTITHSRRGIKIAPHEVVVIEACEGKNVVASFDFTPKQARIWAQRLIEFADAIETKKAS